MRGLREHDRDATVPLSAGDADLVPPSCEAVMDLVTSRLALDEAPVPVAVEWTYARWKPGVSMSCGYALRYDDGATRSVHVKRWRGDKPGRFTSADLEGLGADWTDDRLRPWSWQPRSRLLAVVSPADRSLPGLHRVLQTRRLVRQLRGAGVCGEGRPRAHRTLVVLLRHRPGRRAVLSVDVGVRLPDGGHDSVRLAARVLPPAVAARVAAARRALATALGPQLRLSEPRTGILLEDWLDVHVSSPCDFSQAERAGDLIGQLHRHPTGAQLPLPERDGSQDAEILSRFAALANRHRLPGVAGPRQAPVWSHGDFHPDQIGVAPDGTMHLLDLDEVGVRDPTLDLASWIADAVVEAPESDAEAVAAPLLAGYARSAPASPSWPQLRVRVAEALVARAAAGLRRLDRGAVERAASLLQRAHALAGLPS